MATKKTSKPKSGQPKTVIEAVHSVLGLLSSLTREQVRRVLAVVDAYYDL